MSKTVSRRDFLAGAAAGTMGVASLSGMVAANVAKADEAPVAAGTYDIMSQYSTVMSFVVMSVMIVLFCFVIMSFVAVSGLAVAGA